MATYTFNVTETNSGQLEITADSLEEADALIHDAWLEGQVVWGSVDMSYELADSEPANTNN